MHKRNLILTLIIVTGIAGCQLLGQGGVYVLNVGKTPDDVGSVSPPGKQFEEGSRITLNAAVRNNEFERDNFRFYRWQGDINTTENPHTFSIKRDTEVTAVFGWYEYSLTVQVEGNGQVIREEFVGARPGTEGGHAVNDPDKDYKRGTEVQLEAAAGEGSKFCYWRGENFSYCRGENPTVAVDQNGNRGHVAMWWDDMEVTAVFKPELEPCGSCTLAPNPDF